jgi:hypothetical protein
MKKYDTCFYCKNKIPHSGNDNTYYAVRQREIGIMHNPHIHVCGCCKFMLAGALEVCLYEIENNIENPKRKPHRAIKEVAIGNTGDT